MRTNFKLLSCLIVLVIVIGCGGGDDSTVVTPPPPNDNMEDSINDYWPTSREMEVAFVDMSNTLEQIEAAFNAKTIDNNAITDLVNSYVLKTVAAASKMDDMLQLENQIHAYGQSKGMFTNAVTSVAKGVFNTVKKVVVSSGQMVRTSWRVLSGSYTLRDALKAPDSGIPIVSDFAKRLQEHNATRDQAIIDAIERNDTEEGNVPISQLQGNTTQEKIDYYRNLPDSDPLKKQTRGNVHLWDVQEKTETVKTLKKAASDQVKNYVGATSGSDLLVEVGDQSLSTGQTPQDKGTVRNIVKDVDTDAILPVHKTLLIQKRDQPQDDQRIIILDGVDPDMNIPLASGVYDVVVMAEGYVRSVTDGLEVAANQTATMLNKMYEFASNSLILEGITADPETATVDNAVTVSATAASILGSDLTFAWTISGGTVKDQSQSGPSMTFTPTLVGPYTVSLELTDVLGNSRTGSVDIDVTGAAVEILDWDVTSEQFSDNEINPGEQVTVSITLANRGTEAVNGTMSLIGHDRIVATLNSSSLNLAVGSQTNVPCTFNLPTDFSLSEGVVTLETATNDVIISQDLVFDVVFGIVIDPISSPVTERVLTISGRVSNPSLPVADLVIAGDINQVFTMNLSNGEFSQDIAVEGSSGTEFNSVVVSADAGSHHAEATTSFTAEVAPSAIRVTLTWNTSGTDVDLWVTDPNGESCGYSHTTTSSGLTLDFDDTNGYGPENITTTTAIAGTYSVRVNYYDDNNDDGATPSGCTVVVRLNEGTTDESITTYSGSVYDTGDDWSAATITIDGTGKALLLAGPTTLGKTDPASMPAKK